MLCQKADSKGRRASQTCQGGNYHLLSIMKSTAAQPSLAHKSSPAHYNTASLALPRTRPAWWPPAALQPAPKSPPSASDLLANAWPHTPAEGAFDHTCKAKLSLLTCPASLVASCCAAALPPEEHHLLAIHSHMPGVTLPAEGAHDDTCNLCNNLSAHLSC
jgi:hypothetical protein